MFALDAEVFAVCRARVPWRCLSVKSRMLINALDEQIWVIDLPAFDCLDGALMVQGTLGDVMVVCGQVLGERGTEVTSAAYPVCRKVIFPRSF